MIVRIGNEIFDSSKQPMMIVLDDKEKQLISQMEEQKKFCSYPESWDKEEIEKFMLEF